MGCRGSKHALHGAGAWVPEPPGCSGLVTRRSVALRSSTLGTLSLDRAAAAAASAAVCFAGGEGVMMKSGEEGGGVVKCRRATRSVASGWCPASPMAPVKRQRRAPPRTPTKTPLRDPEEINVWELMEGLEDDDGEEEEEDDNDNDAERQVVSPSGSPLFDPDVLAAFEEALDELSPPPDAVTHYGAAVKKDELEMFGGVVRSRVDVFQPKTETKLAKEAASPGPPPPPDSARRVVVYLTSLRGIRQTYEDCWSTSAILRSYGVHVDERDLSMHAGYKDELRAALVGPAAARPGHGRLPHVFVDGWYLGGAEEVRCMHESGELAEALEGCEMAPGATGGKEGSLAVKPCGGCGGVRFVPCDECSGSCRVFVEDKDGAGAFKRCPECNENGLIRCPIC